MKFALGPTMAVRRSCVQQMGGFGVLGPYCSDDFLLGAQVAAQGKTVMLSHHVIDHIILNLSFTASLRHQTRWMKSTRFSRPLGHLGTALTFSVPFGMLACLAAIAMHRPLLGLSLLAYSIANRIILAALVGSRAVRERHLLRAILLLSRARLPRLLLLGRELPGQHDSVARSPVSPFARRPHASCWGAIDG